MAANKGTKGAAKAPAKKAEQAATAAAPATAEQLATQPAAATEQPASEATTGLETGNQGPDAPTVLIVGGLAVGDYIAALKAGGIDVQPLAELPESLLRLVGQFVEIEGYDVLPPEQLILRIGQKFGIAARVTGPDGGYADGDSYRQYPSDVSPGVDPLAQALAELNDDGEVEGLWITAVPEQGFRRCGFRFTREGLGIALSALTEQQIEQLEREPNLKVERGVFSGRVA